MDGLGMLGSKANEWMKMKRNSTIKVGFDRTITVMTSNPPRQSKIAPWSPGL